MNNDKKPVVLLTNDDGYQAAGLRALADELKDFAQVQIVAPSWERSGAAQSLTLRQPIVCHRIAENEWAIDGTPADCVIVALHKLLQEPPDLVISGINHGANLGENVYYSGTVGAAREAVIHHVPGFAMSLCSKRVNADFAPSAKVARRTAEMILKEGLPPQVLLNVNVPESWKGAVRFSAPIEKDYAHGVARGRRSQGPPLFLAKRAAHRPRHGVGCGFRLRRNICRGSFRHAVASGSHAHGIVEPLVSLGLQASGITSRASRPSREIHFAGARRIG